MNLNMLTNHGMVTITGEWMENLRLVAEITNHPLGPPVWAEVKAAHALVEEHGEASLGVDDASAPRTSVTKVRAAWIRAVHLLLDVQDFLGTSAEARAMLLAPLQDGIDDAARRRARPPGEQDVTEAGDDSGHAAGHAVTSSLHAHGDAELDAPTLELDDDMTAGVLACDDVVL